MLLLYKLASVFISVLRAVLHFVLGVTLCLIFGQFSILFHGVVVVSGKCLGNNGQHGLTVVQGEALLELFDDLSSVKKTAKATKTPK